MILSCYRYRTFTVLGPVTEHYQALPIRDVESLKKNKRYAVNASNGNVR